MDEPRSPISARLDRLGRSIAGLERAVALRGAQARTRAAWWTDEHPPIGPARTIRERHARLTPRRTEIHDAGDRGRILRTTERVEAGEVLLAEPALVRAGPPERDDGLASPFPWRLVVVLDRPGVTESALVDDLHNAHASRIRVYADLARGLRERGLDLPVDPDRAGRLLGVVRTNAFGRPTTGETALYPTCAMAAHRCEPSADRFVEDGTLFFQARRDLEAGDEVTISYLDSTREAAFRLPVLLTRYGFLCDCPRCAAAIRRDDIDLEEVRREAAAMEETFLAIARGEDA